MVGIITTEYNDGRDLAIQIGKQSWFYRRSRSYRKIEKQTPENQQVLVFIHGEEGTPLARLGR